MPTETPLELARLIKAIDLAAKAMTEALTLAGQVGRLHPELLSSYLARLDRALVQAQRLWEGVQVSSWFQDRAELPPQMRAEIESGLALAQAKAQEALALNQELGQIMTQEYDRVGQELGNLSQGLRLLGAYKGHKANVPRGVRRQV